MQKQANTKPRRSWQERADRHSVLPSCLRQTSNTALPALLGVIKGEGQRISGVTLFICVLVRQGRTHPAKYKDIVVSKYCRGMRGLLLKFVGM